MRSSEFDVAVIGGGIVGSALAAALAGRGTRVVIVDRGSASLAGMVRAEPEIRLTGRMHLGCTQARNHVLGGNGYFWGGGLIRPPRTDLASCLGIEVPAAHALAEDLSGVFARAEREAGIGDSPGRALFPVRDPGIGACHLAEMCVLPGRLRNISRPALARLASAPGCEILSGAVVTGFVPAGPGSGIRSIRSVEVRCKSTARSVSAKRFVIAAGAIDSNLLVLEHAGALGMAGREDDIGGELHDHFSLPIARVRLPPREEIRELLAPRFRRGNIVGRRFELISTGGWGAQGFLHFQFLFDDVAPYREIKNLLALRQQGAPALDLLRATAPILAQAPELLKIGIDRVLRERLYLSNRLPVVATLDFETFPRKEQRLQRTGDRVELSWGISKDDEQAFFELSGKAGRLLSELAQSHGIEVEPLCDFANAEAAGAYLQENATDAFHLGGGLKAGMDGDGLVDAGLRLTATENVHVIASAVFRRPGVVNPTSTLLALAHRFAATLAG
jgi:choline dehydrogenase-like flavoprotein